MHLWSMARLRCPITISPAGSAARWLVALRDEQKIYGVRHPRTGKVFVPPRQVDERDFTPLDAIGSRSDRRATVTGFTIIRYAEPYQPLPTPYGLALIRLDGADTALRTSCGSRISTG